MNWIPGNSVPVMREPIMLNINEQKLADLKNWFAVGLYTALQYAWLSQNIASANIDTNIKIYPFHSPS